MGHVAMPRPVDDLYADLGVQSDASADELALAFRARAKELHPDTVPADPDAAERFKRVSRAYAVLRDPTERARYDAGVQVRLVGSAASVGASVSAGSRGSDRAPYRTADEGRASTSATVRAVPAPVRHWQLGRRGARNLVVGGVLLLVFGIISAGWVIALQRHDADLRASGVPVTAHVVQVDGQRRFQFTTRSGETVRATESTKSGTEAPAIGSTVAIRYDRDDPSQIVVDASHFARDITLWIVAVKLVVGGALLVFFGARRLRQRTP